MVSRQTQARTELGSTASVTDSPSLSASDSASVQHLRTPTPGHTRSDRDGGARSTTMPVTLCSAADWVANPGPSPLNLFPASYSVILKSNCVFKKNKKFSSLSCTAAKSKRCKVCCSCLAWNFTAWVAGPGVGRPQQKIKTLSMSELSGQLPRCWSFWDVGASFYVMIQLSIYHSLESALRLAVSESYRIWRHCVQEETSCQIDSNLDGNLKIY